MKLWGLLLGTLLLSSSAHAGAPTRVTFVLKEKMSCREVKKLFNIDRLFVQCNAKKPMARAWAAHYFGRESLKEVLKAIAAYTKVETAQENEGALPAAYAADIDS